VKRLWVDGSGITDRIIGFEIGIEILSFYAFISFIEGRQCTSTSEGLEGKWLQSSEVYVERRTVSEESEQLKLVKSQLSIYDVVMYPGNVTSN
jgi:hypothetical protein